MDEPHRRRPLLTVVTPVFNEESTVERCYEEVRRVCESLADRYDYEHIFGDNRSTDRTLALLREIAARDERVRVLAYSRNFGADKSALTLLRHASGDVTVGITADLQEPPDVIPKMLGLWELGNQVVYGVYSNPHERLVMRGMRRFYYRLIDALSADPLPPSFNGFALLDRAVLDEVIQVDDHFPYVRGLIATVGFKQVSFTFERAPRISGESKHGLRFLLEFGLNGIISHSVAPLRVATYTGMVLSVSAFGVALLYAVILVLRAIGLVDWAIQTPATGVLILITLFFSGVQLLFLGLVGEYVGAIHSQVRRKPFVIVEEQINFPHRRPPRRHVPEPALQPDERLVRESLRSAAVDEEAAPSSAGAQRE